MIRRHIYTPSNEIKHYLEMCISQIDNCEFEKIYDGSEAHSIPHREISDALLEAGINPLQFMDYVPYAFLRGSRRSNKNFIIPDNITGIEGYAFAGTDIDIIHVPEGVLEILTGAFSNCPDLYKIYLPNSLKKLGDRIFTGSNTNENNGILNIIYNGTREEWDKIIKKPKWLSLNPQFDVIIECTDDMFSYSGATGDVDFD